MGIITISRTHGSMGTIFAARLAEKLRYRCVDSESIRNACHEKEHVHSFGLDEEGSPSFIHRIEELMTNRNFYKATLMANVYDCALKNNVVFVGLGAHVILSGLSDVVTLRVIRLLSERVRAIAKAKSVPPEEALSLVEKMDSAKKEFVEHFFDKDVDEPTQYHLTLNSSYVSLENALDMVSNYCAKYFSSAHSIETVNHLRNRLLEKRAELLLFRLGLVHDYAKVVFEAHGEGVLTVKGVIGGSHDKERLLETLRNMKSVKGIEDHLKVGILSQLLY
jgi:CMP/dCMP kinase